MKNKLLCFRQKILQVKIEQAISGTIAAIYDMMEMEIDKMTLRQRHPKWRCLIEMGLSNGS